MCRISTELITRDVFVKETCCVCEDLCSTTAVVPNLRYVSSFHIMYEVGVK